MSTEDRSETAGPPPTESRSGGRTPRFLPHLPALAVLVLELAVLVWLHVADPMGDRGSLNVFTYMLVLLMVLTYAVWFAIWSGGSWRRRLAPITALVLFFVAFLTLFRIEGFYGDMVPRIVPRSAEAPDRLLSRQVAGDRGAAAGVDLRTTTADDFDQFLGPDRSAGIDHLRLARDWQAEPPEPVWKREIGAGWSAFAVVNGYAVTLEQRGDQEMVTCYEVLSGEPCWAHATPARYELTIAGTGPRSTPTIDDGWVYAQGATGRLVALDGATGELMWEKDLLAETGISPEDEAKYLPYGRSGSPLVVDDLVVIPAGGPPEGRQGVALGVPQEDRRAGLGRWRTPNQLRLAVARDRGWCPPDPDRQ